MNQGGCMQDKKIDESQNDSPHIYKSITSVMREIGVSGITKEDRVSHGAGGGFKYRGIDSIYNALSPILAKNNLCILPDVREREVIERNTKNGTAMFYVVLKVDFHFVSSIDSTRHIVTVFGEAMDTSDKATNKAMSAAYKYACIQTFCIPTEGDNDPDASVHDVLPIKNITEKVSRDCWERVIMSSFDLDSLKKNFLKCMANAETEDDKADITRIKDIKKQFFSELEDIKTSTK